MKKNIFAEYVVHDLLSHVDGVVARAMFGGHGVYKDGYMFALIADDELYFKVDEKSTEDFKKHGSEPFTYSKGRTKPVVMSYWLLPEEVADDQELLTDWVMRSYNTAKRTKKKK